MLADLPVRDQDAAEQVGMLRRRVQDAGTAKGEQDAAVTPSSIAGAGHGKIARLPEGGRENLRNMASSLPASYRCTLRVAFQGPGGGRKSIQ